MTNSAPLDLLVIFKRDRFRKCREMFDTLVDELDGTMTLTVNNLDEADALVAYAKALGATATYLNPKWTTPAQWRSAWVRSDEAKVRVFPTGMSVNFSRM